ncbi:flagellar basal body-associated protein FliL [Sutcliffiella halmapala]|jgi:flagellar protein FliL|uniref:flagellar basal body-associated protein FliL n=1 Tax=Sutcliffiella halmapala TaxID=79882 RepID=UPI000994D88D|nr:flagellar basal body-associated protein FliL [Sutcliffiella halmapala]
MFRNKLVNTMIIILLIITLLGVVALITMNVFYADNSTDTESIDEIIKHTVDIEEITTNLKSGGYLRVQFKVQTDSKKARTELEKREFQVRSIVIHEISNKKSSDFGDDKGIENLEKEIQTKLNEVMQDGLVVQVYTTSFLLQN